MHWISILLLQMLVHKALNALVSDNNLCIDNERGLSHNSVTNFVSLCVFHSFCVQLVRFSMSPFVHKSSTNILEFIYSFNWLVNLFISHFGTGAEPNNRFVRSNFIWRRHLLCCKVQLTSFEYQLTGSLYCQ